MPGGEGFTGGNLLRHTGLLSFAAKVVLPGRTFVRRLFDAATSMPHIDTQTRLLPEAMDDIHWWAACCEDWNGKALFVNSKWTSSEDVKLWTDASGQGFGIAFDKEWSYGTWCPDKELQSIEWKELCPMVLALAMWGSHLSG